MPPLLAQVNQLLELKKQCEAAISEQKFYIELTGIKIDEFVAGFPTSSNEIRQSVAGQFISECESCDSAASMLECIKRSAFTPHFVDKSVFFSDVVQACTGNIQCMQIQIRDIVSNIQHYQQILLGEQQNVRQILSIKGLYDASQALQRAGELLQRVRRLLPDLLEYKSSLQRQQLSAALASLKRLKAEPLCVQLSSLKDQVSVDDAQLSQMVSNSIQAKFKAFLAEADKQVKDDAASLSISLAQFLTNELYRQLHDFASFQLIQIDELKYLIKKLVVAVSMLVHNARFCEIKLSKQQCFEMAVQINKTLQTAIQHDSFCVSSFADINETAKYQCLTELAAETFYRLLTAEFGFDLSAQLNQMLRGIQASFRKLLDTAFSQAISRLVFDKFVFQKDVYINQQQEIKFETQSVYTYVVDAQSVLSIAQEPHFFARFMEMIHQSAQQQIGLPVVRTSSTFVDRFVRLLAIMCAQSAVRDESHSFSHITKFFDRLAVFLQEQLGITPQSATLQLFQQSLLTKQAEKPFLALFQKQKTAQPPAPNMDRDFVVSAEVFDALGLSLAVLAAFQRARQLCGWIEQVQRDLPAFLLKKLLCFEAAFATLSTSAAYASNDVQHAECQSSAAQAVFEHFAGFVKALCLLHNSAFLPAVKHAFAALFEEGFAGAISKIARSTAVGRRILLNDVSGILSSFEAHGIVVPADFLKALAGLWFDGDELSVRGFLQKQTGWKRDAVRAALQNAGCQLGRAQLREILK